MKTSMYPCIWFDGNAAGAASFYRKAFKEVTVVSENPMVVMLDTAGTQLMLLNGGAQFRPNPAISMMVLTADEDEIRDMWNSLTQDGKVLMGLDAYPWSKLYGWLEDKYGVSWQLYWGKQEDIVQKYVPNLMFCGANNGRAEEAIQLYTFLFPNSGVQGILKYPPGGDQPENHVMHAQFHVNGYVMMAMDSGGTHEFNFTEGVSLVVECEDQKTLDKYWNTLTSVGGKEGMCGWLTDRFGVSWQLIPQMLSELLLRGDAAKNAKMMQALLKMKKLDIARLESAYNS